MTNKIKPNEKHQLASTHDPDVHNTSVRESFSARLLTDPQFDECMAITSIIGREIRHSGTFKEKLGDYSYAFARSQKMDAAKTETIVRDLFKERTGQTMNQMREKLINGEEKISDDQRQKAYQSACDIGGLMEQGNKLTFHRTLATQSQNLAKDFGITDKAARRIMSDEFNKAEGTRLYDWGKELDEQIFRPQIDAEKNKRSQDVSGDSQRSAATRTSQRQLTR